MKADNSRATKEAVREMTMRLEVRQYQEDTRRTSSVSNAQTSITIWACGFELRCDVFLKHGCCNKHLFKETINRDFCSYAKTTVNHLILVLKVKKVF